MKTPTVSLFEAAQGIASNMLLYEGKVGVAAIWKSGKDTFEVQPLAGGRDELGLAIRKHVKRRRRVAIIAEAWAASTDGDMSKPPSQRDDRYEMITAHLFESGKPTAYAVRRFKRGEGGWPILDGEWEEETSDLKIPEQSIFATTPTRQTRKGERR